MALGITSRDHRSRNGKLEHTLSYLTAQASMRIIELENRCTGNRTVGSNPTLSVPGNWLPRIPRVIMGCNTHPDTQHAKGNKQSPQGKSFTAGVRSLNTRGSRIAVSAGSYFHRHHRGTTEGTCKRIKALDQKPKAADEIGLAIIDSKAQPSLITGQ